MLLSQRTWAENEPINDTFFLPSWEWSISNFSWSLSRNITSYRMKNLVFHSLLRWKMIVLPILTTLLIHFSLKSLENVLVELRSERVRRKSRSGAEWLEFLWHFTDRSDKHGRTKELAGGQGGQLPPPIKKPSLKNSRNRNTYLNILGILGMKSYDFR